MYQVEHKGGNMVAVLEIGDTVSVPRINPATGELMPVQLRVKRTRKHQDRSKYTPR